MAPNVSEDHQTRNAEVFVKRGAGFLLPEPDLMSQGGRIIEQVLTDQDLRGRMALSVRALYNPEAEAEMVQAIVQVAKGQGV